jgi:predicted O-methyltransferase YrrM
MKSKIPYWKDFEELVAAIETMAAPRGAVVACNDHLTDIVTGEKRQVDVSIRFRAGTTEILIILPCGALKTNFLSFKMLRDMDICQMVEIVCKICKGYISPMQVKSEIISLLRYVKGIKPKIVMEIGTARGGTLFLFSRVVPEDAVIISVDLYGGEYGGGYPWWKIPLYRSFAMRKQIIHLIREDSHDENTLQKVKILLGDKQVDFLFIDGDHTYEGVKRDFELYSQIVKEGGAIAFHDIVYTTPDVKCEVYKCWDEIKEKYEHSEFIEDRKQNWAGIGIIRKKKK